MVGVGHFVLGGTALQVNERVTGQKSYKPPDISGDRAIAQLTFCHTVQETLTPSMSDGMQDARKPDTRHYDGRPEANLPITVRVPLPVLSLATATDYRLPTTDYRLPPTDSRQPTADSRSSALSLRFLLVGCNHHALQSTDGM
jgi:hypothetical protein